MIEIADLQPDVAVQTAEYVRLLGYPRGWVMRDRAAELAGWASDWFTRQGTPWVYAREAASLDTTGEAVIINGVTFSSGRLMKTLRDAGARSVVLVAASAGPELEAEAQRLWEEGKPDEYFFLEVYGSAVVEHLTTMMGARLCAWADSQGLAVLPHYSPGYPDWEIGEQPRLLSLVATEDAARLPGALSAFDSGMLRPKKSQLAVFGLTPDLDRVQRLTDLVPCSNCSYGPCQYRRAPYRKTTAPESLAKYTVNVKALQRWTRERLSIDERPDGTVDAVFRYEGTTCTNMGRPLEFRYHVTLGPRDEGYPIRAQGCTPAEGDTGYASMCRYLTQRDDLLVTIDQEQPLHGRPLQDVIAWARPTASAGCYCEGESREHKWGLVLETLHYALTQREANR